MSKRFLETGTIVHSITVNWVSRTVLREPAWN